MRVTIVFCEGPHDIHFSARSLMRHAGYQRFQGAASKLPTPFGWEPADKLDKQVGVVMQQVRRLDTLSLDLDLEGVNFGRKPLFELAMHNLDTSLWIIFVNMGGDGTAEEVATLIKLIRGAMVAPNKKTEEIAFAFLFDADYLADRKGKSWRLQNFQANSHYKALFGELSAVAHGSWVDCTKDSKTHRVGFWIHAGDPEEGTLEDHAGLAASTHRTWSPLLTNAETFVRGQLPGDHALFERRDKLWKAKLTIVGQLQKRFVSYGSRYIAGGSMNVVIERALPDECFDADICKEIAEFLSSAWS